MSLGVGELVGSTILVCLLIPLAILISRDRLRKYRRGLLLALEEMIYKGEKHRPMTAFEVARIKYEMGPHNSAESGTEYSDVSRGSMLSFVLPALVYSSLAASVFTMALFLAQTTDFWSRPNLILSGLKTFDGPDLIKYQMQSGVLITAGFLGAYMFSLQFLIQKVRNYELSPTSFLIASVTLLEGCFVVAVARHLVPDGGYSSAIPFAFLLGYFPTFGISWIMDHLRVQHLKRVDPAAYNARYVMPTDMVDGIDMLTKFRLSEAGIYDIQNLATANPVLLYVETPYNLLTILDWMAEAQLMVELGSGVTAKLRPLGIRTIRDVATVMSTPTLEINEEVAKLIWPCIKGGRPETYSKIVSLISGKLHVRRLDAFVDALGDIIDGKSSRSGPGQFRAAAE